MTDDAQRFWDAQASGFDEEPDHGLLDPDVRAAWSGILLPMLPPAPGRIADLGCGTGSITVLLAEAGYEVHGVDFSERMVAKAKAKAADAGVTAELVQGDAALPPFGAVSFDVVFARHVLWALPDPDAALARWVGLLRPGGYLVLIEGRWATGGGIAALQCQEMVSKYREVVSVRRLEDPRLWGRVISDERYLLVSPH